MKELSLNILDIAENSVRAKADLVEILLEEDADKLTVIIRDNGCGIDANTLKRLKDPFYTTRATRSIGLGIPLFALAAEQTGGGLEIISDTTCESHGTTLTATFYTSHIDCAPLGDMTSTLLTLIQGSPEIDFYFSHRLPGMEVFLDTRQLRATLGEDIPLNSPEILLWIRGYIREQYETFDQKN